MHLLDTIVGLYAPHACLGCGDEGSPLCEACYGNLPDAGSRCYRCKRQTARGRVCADCRPHTPLVSVNAVTIYDETGKQLIAGLKFGRMLATADGIGRHMALLYGDKLPEDTFVVPVPTARKRVRARGYDQAELIARSFAKHAGLRYAPLLMRLGFKEQKGADRLQRQEQLTGAYVLRRPQQTAGARLVLIDDVLTTGSTLEAAGRTLKEAGAGPIAALVFAKV